MMETKRDCHCLIRHAVTPDVRKAVVQRLDSARATGDGMALMLGIAALGPCPNMKQKDLM